VLRHAVTELQLLAVVCVNCRWSCFRTLAVLWTK